ncbi:MAG: CdaR family protein [Fimbriimonadales bacterium]|nr:CdaR family protein [Fimbriimonadales bacterium]MDW8052333.1 CdaR family protein [Armatimonadota bacterium]
MRWRENLLEKVGALATAILLTLYVQSQLHPIIERVYETPVELLNAPPNYEARLETGNRMRITVRGVKELVEATRADQLRAYIDLSEAKPGENRLPIRLEYPAEWRDRLTVQPERTYARLVLEPRLSRVFPVRVNLTGVPDLQGVLAEAVPEPSSVRITGAASHVRRIRAVQVAFDLTGLTGDLEVETTPTPVDEQGNPVLNAQVVPAEVRLKIRLIPQPNFKTVPVSPRLDDLPPFPYRVIWFSVEPVSVQLRGSPARLAQINVIETAPISLRAITRDTEIRVPLKAPAGVQVVGAKEAIVRVRIRKEVETEPAPTKPADEKLAPAQPKEGTTDGTSIQ